MESMKKFKQLTKAQQRVIGGGRRIGCSIGGAPATCSSNDLDKCTYACARQYENCGGCWEVIG